MRVRRLEITAFRGIRKADWRHIQDTVGLVGPGDSCKTALIDALERVLSPRWNVPFDDSDFFNLDTANPIRIRATVVDFPRALLRETKFGLALHAWAEGQGEAIAPTGQPGEAFALVIELRVDASLEPVWNVLGSDGREHPMHARDRETLGMLRIGGQVDAHLGWSRGSILTRLTESGDQVASVLSDATRRARAGLSVQELGRLQEAATAVEALGRTLGVAVRNGLTPHLDVASIAFTGGALSLHDGPVPLRRAGLGSRRLLAMAMQRSAVEDGGLTLVDEFEHGLEPHRIRRLLRRLKGIPPEEPVEVRGQVIVTTHSPTVISELTPAEVAIVRRDGDGDVQVRAVPEPLQRMVLRNPAALLARKVVVAVRDRVKRPPVAVA